MTDISSDVMLGAARGIGECKSGDRKMANLTVGREASEWVVAVLVVGR